MLDVSSWSTELEERGAELDGSWESSTDREEKQLNQEWIASTRKGCKIPAEDARSTAEVEDGKHTSGGVVIGVKNEVASVVDTTGSKVESFQDKRRNNFTLVGELQRWISPILRYVSCIR